MPEQIKIALQQGGLYAMPIVIGMVQAVKEKVREMTPTRWFDQLVGSAVTAVVIVVIGYAMGIPRMEENQRSLAKAMEENQKASVVQFIELKSDVKEVKTAISTDKLNGIVADNALDKRMSLMELEHRSIIEILGGYKHKPAQSKRND